MSEDVVIRLTRDELTALLPEHPGDNSALSRAHNQFRDKLANFDHIALSDPHPEGESACECNGTGWATKQERCPDCEEDR